MTKLELEVKLATIHCWHEEEDFVRQFDSFTICVCTDEGYNIESDRYSNVFEANDMSVHRMTKAKWRAHVWKEMKAFYDEGFIHEGDVEEY